MGAPDVTKFLTSLAVDGQVAASTQNQALNGVPRRSRRRWCWRPHTPVGQAPLPADAVSQRLDAYIRAATMDPKEAMRAWAPGFFSGTAPRELVDEVVAIVSEFDPRVLVTLARSFAETDLRDMFSTIDIPTLLLYGDADSRSPLPLARALHASIRRSELVVLPGVGHLSNVEAADRFDNAVRTFLRSHST
jgi:pimeloyl-ACP methyl ester carboxylesterase